VNATTIRHVIFRGRVQGVGFRDFIERAAARQGVEGWVRNRRDGTVEALIAGTLEQIEQVIALGRRGPRAANVEAVDVREGGASELALRPAGAPFVTLPTV
jgi:acylphosphatase